jgi:hypothetical protein
MATLFVIQNQVANSIKDHPEMFQIAQWDQRQSWYIPTKWWLNE